MPIVLNVSCCMIAKNWGGGLSLKFFSVVGVERVVVYSGLTGSIYTDRLSGVYDLLEIGKP